MLGDTRRLAARAGHIGAVVAIVVDGVEGDALPVGRPPWGGRANALVEDHLFGGAFYIGDDDGALIVVTADESDAVAVGRP